MTGTWIAFEGVDGSGKSTQAGLLLDALDALGGPTLATREPGGTPTAEAVRSVVLDPALAVSDRTEALLMAAARAQLLHEVIAPALEAGTTVVSDRSVASSLAYQGYGRGLDVGEVASVNRWALNDRWPDVFVLIDCDLAEVARRRTGAPDRIEASDTAFYERVAAGFLSLAEADPQRWVVVDGNNAAERVAADVHASLAERGVLG